MEVLVLLAMLGPVACLLGIYVGVNLSPFRDLRVIGGTAACMAVVLLDLGPDGAGKP